MRQKRFTFKNRSGHEMAALLDLPVDGTPEAYAIFAHCFTCSKNLSAVSRITRAMTRQGMAVMRFDFTGLGESGGDFSDTGFSTNVSDIVDAARYLEEHYGPARVLVGHSMGGTAALAAAGKLDEVAAVAVIGSPAEPDHVLKHMGEKLTRIMEKGGADVPLSGKTLHIRRAFVEDVQKVDMAPIVKGLKKALMVLHSPIDEVVGIDHAARIYQMARHPKSFVSLDRADHLLTDKRDALYAGDLIASWAARYIEKRGKEEKTEAAGDHRVSARTGPGGFTTDIQVDRHRLVADEPASLGGADLGPTPYDLLTAALGACTAMTLRMYADRKGWPLDSATVRLTHRKIHADDCGTCDTKEGKLDEIVREIELEGPIDDEKRERLLEIADRCPVHRSLHGEIVVKTRLAKG